MLFATCRHDQTIYEVWAKQVDEICTFNQQQSLLLRNEETKLISVNFDPKVCVGEQTHTCTVLWCGLRLLV